MREVSHRARSGPWPGWTQRLRLWLAPGMGVKRFLLVAVLGVLIAGFGVVMGTLWLLDDARRVITTPVRELLASPAWQTWGGWLALLLGVAGTVIGTAAVRGLNRSVLSNWVVRPEDAALMLHQRLQASRGPSIVAFGGGTGLSTLLRGLRDATSNLSAIVTVADDGGSSGRLREAFDMPAPGDLSDCLAALSDEEQEVGRLMGYRFVRGGEFRGHTFGNLLITTLSEVEGDIGRATRVLNRLLDLKGAVWPVTSQPVALLAHKEGGVRVTGESRIASVPGRVERLSIVPGDAPALPEVLSALDRADLIVLGPGSLFTSVLAPLLVPQVKARLARVRAPLLYVANIMTEAGETDGMDVYGHASALYDHIGRWPDVILVNDRPVDEPRIASYREEAADVVAVDFAALDRVGVRVIAADLLADGRYAQHDSARLAEVVLRVATAVRDGEVLA